MTDNELIKLFLPIIQAGLIADGFTGVTVKQANQPTQQGIPVAPTVYFFKTGDRRYGFRSQSTTVVDSVLTQITRQWYETTFKVRTMVLQDPSNTDAYTASDLVNEVAAIMQSPETIQALINPNNVGILRVTDVTNEYVKDDRDQFEAIPSFNFTLTHLQTRITQPPMVNSYEIDIYPI